MGIELPKENKNEMPRIFCAKSPSFKHNFAAGTCSWCDTPQETGRKLKGVREFKNIGE